MAADDAGHAHPAAGDLLEDHRERHHVDGHAAVLLGHEQPEQAHLAASSRRSRPGSGPAASHSRATGRICSSTNDPHRVAEQPLLVGELEVHAGLPTAGRGRSPTWAAAGASIDSRSCRRGTGAGAQPPDSRAPGQLDAAVRPRPGEADRIPVAGRARSGSGSPVANASIIMPPPITMPTWPGRWPVPSDPAKNTRSPGCDLAGRDPRPPDPLLLRRARDVDPRCPVGLITRPEQSKASGPVPPHRYGLPSLLLGEGDRGRRPRCWPSAPTPGRQSGALSTVTGLTEKPPFA